MMLLDMNKQIETAVCISQKCVYRVGVCGLLCFWGLLLLVSKNNPNFWEH